VTARTRRLTTAPAAGLNQRAGGNRPLPRMKKLFWFALAFALAAYLGVILKNTWETTEFFLANGREATVKVGKKYNASRWAEPLPIKKISAYTGTLAEKHEVLIETDWTLNEKQTYPIRFLLRDVAAEARRMSVRNLANNIRLHTKEDGTPVTLQDTDLFERALDKVMGPPAAGVYIRPRPVAEAAPDTTAPTVPFLFVEPGAVTWQVIWNNTQPGEWAVLVGWLLTLQWLFTHAWNLPWRPGARLRTDRENSIHPSMRRIDADQPDAPSAKVRFTPRPDPVAETPAPPSPPAPPPPRTVALPPKDDAAKSEPPVPYSTAITAPPFEPPAGTPEPTLKLARKKNPDAN
jgi:hypothetical protein